VTGATFIGFVNRPRAVIIKTNPILVGGAARNPTRYWHDKKVKNSSVNALAVHISFVKINFI